MLVKVFQNDDATHSKLMLLPSAMDSLLVKPISKSSANQRAGRAGREVCLVYPMVTYLLLSSVF